MSKRAGKRAGFSKGRQLSGPGMVPRFRKTAPSNKTLNRKIKKIHSKQELKQIDRNFSAQTISTTAGFFSMSLIAQGDDKNQRDGNDINNTSIQWRLKFTSDPDAVTQATVRMIVFWDQQCNGADPAIGELLDTSVITTVITSPYNKDNQKRFKILQDSIITLNPLVVGTFTPATGVTTALIPYSRYLRGKRPLSRPTKYDATTAAVTSIVTNQLLIMFVSDLAAELPTVTGGFRLYFKDT